MPAPSPRRRFLSHTASCLGALGVGWGLGPQLGATDLIHPLAARPRHRPVKAKRLIKIFLTGGFSHVDTFDPKPLLQRDRDKAMSGKMSGKFLKGPVYDFQSYSKCGTEVSSLFPEIGSCMDDICLIRSMKTDHGNHFQATLAMHTGSTTVPMPSLGSWLSYGCGTRNTDLPSYVVLAEHLPYAGAQVWDNSFLPAIHQGMRVTPGNDPIPNLKPRTTAVQQGRELDLLAALNEHHAAQRPADNDLKARIVSYKTAFGMQQLAPKVFDLRKESESTHKLYGLKRGDRESFAWQCLVARRLAESGVRCIELIHTGSNKNWDAHGNIDTHKKLAGQIDRPIAGLLKDLRRRGMLDETLVVFCTEFGRTPYVTKKGHRGREHHPRVFSCWLAGAGVNAGTVYGSSDDYGIDVAENKVHLHDFHATILHLMGFDHEALTYRYAGRDFRLTDVHGHVVKGVLA